jgi:hypothetical protein
MATNNVFIVASFRLVVIPLRAPPLSCGKAQYAWASPGSVLHVEMTGVVSDCISIQTASCALHEWAYIRLMSNTTLITYAMTRTAPVVTVAASTAPPTATSIHSRRIHQ